MTTLSNAADILRCFSAERPHLTVTEAARLIGAPKSNASRLLRAMLAAGYLETVGNSKHYRPGLLLYEAGRLYRDASTLIARAAAVVSRISAETGHTGFVSKRDGRDIVAVVDCIGTNALHVASHVGRRLEAFACATGRSLLARLSDDQVRALYPGGFTPPSPNAPQNVDDLFIRLAAIRRSGCAEATDEANRGVGAVAIAVGDPHRGEDVSLCIAFPLSMIDDEQKREIVAALRSGAADIAAITRDPLFAHPLDPARIDAARKNETTAQATI